MKTAKVIICSALIAQICAPVLALGADNATSTKAALPAYCLIHSEGAPLPVFKPLRALSGKYITGPECTSIVEPVSFGKMFSYLKIKLIINLGVWAWNHSVSFLYGLLPTVQQAAENQSL